MVWPASEAGIIHISSSNPLVTNRRHAGGVPDAVPIAYGTMTVSPGFSSMFC